jgi:hypothetical protein
VDASDGNQKTKWPRRAGQPGPVWSYLTPGGDGWEVLIGDVEKTILFQPTQKKTPQRQAPAAVDLPLRASSGALINPPSAATFL